MGKHRRAAILKTVYFYAVDSGALDIMSPIVQASPGNIQSRWVADGYAKKKLLSKGINVMDINNFLNDKQSICSSREIIIIGSQKNFKKTVEIIENCNKNNIKSIFIFDHWCHYSKHFTSSDGNIYLPTKIFAIDRACKSGLVSHGISDKYVTIVGHPSIEKTKRDFRQLDNERRKKIRIKMGVNSSTKLIVLALEPFKPDAHLGYDEYSTTLSTIKAIMDMKRNDIRLVMRLHPRQSQDEYHCFLERNQLQDTIIICPEDVNIAESIVAADLVLGMNSVFLIHARAVGKPALSLQLNRTSLALSSTNPHLEAIVVTDPGQLKDRILEKLHIGKEPPLLIKGGVRKVWNKLIEMCL